MPLSTNRQQALKVISNLSNELKEAIALIVETADAQGDYHYDVEVDSVWEDDVQATLNHLAHEIRQLK